MNAHHSFPDPPLRSSMPHGSARRFMDIAIAIGIFVAFSPLILMTCLAVLAEDGRPIFFRQPRLGVAGRPFLMNKFRKFYETIDGPPLTMTNDSRFTKVGRLLAATKLDELPQLWNVMKGDMAIVGPRPESLEFLECFTCGYEEVLQFRPGLFGPSQVLFRDEAAHFPPGEDPTVFYRAVIFPLKAGLDIAYFRNRTLGTDMTWIIRSATAILGWKKWGSALDAPA